MRSPRSALQRTSSPRGLPRPRAWGEIPVLLSVFEEVSVASSCRSGSAKARSHRQSSAGIQRIICADNSPYPLNRSMFLSTFCLISVHKASKIRRIMILEGSR